MKLVERFCLPVRAIVDLGNGTIVRDRLFQFGRIQMLDLAHSPAESLHYSVLKRIFDMLFSVFVILISAPVMLAIAVAIRLSSSGPVFFSQERVGLNGKVFRMYKFRTMVVGPLAESDTAWTTADDGRRTRLGAFLRRTSLDELPQFLNVLKGDMSVVGPRPERPHFVRKFRSDFSQYHIRHRLKAGITGWAQVNGLRGDTSIQKRVEYDLYYLQNWSLGFDLRIIFMTIAGGLVSKNAY
jgi:exopolysaccharide biosynthesis polyprenyl glycosylphosphotransferase